MTEPLLTIKEVMALLKLSRSTIIRKVEKGELKQFKIGEARNASVRFKKDDVEKLIQKAA